MRLDTFDYPVVILPRSVYVTAGTDRRSSGTHYTPESLTEPIVRYTLEPLVYEGPAEGKPREQWRLKSAKELLDLKICDMACGSGAFLVQVCIYLAARLLEAWEEAEKRVEGSPRITPYGEVSKGLPDEQLIPLDRQERLIYARRLVAERCVYGVDKNPLAVEMAKLSLWLLTLAKDKPFTFLDHAIRCGDSLVGLSSIDQLLRFSMTENAKVRPLMEQQRQQIEKRLEATMLLRKQIETLPSNTPQDIERKTKMFENVEDQTKRLTYAADMLLAATWEAKNVGELESALNGMLAEVEYKFKDLPAEQLEEEARQAGCGRRGSPVGFTGPWSSPRSSWTGRGSMPSSAIRRSWEVRRSPVTSGRTTGTISSVTSLEESVATPTCAPTSPCGPPRCCGRGAVRLPGNEHDRTGRYPRGRARSGDRRWLRHPPSGPQPTLAGHGKPRSCARLVTTGTVEPAILPRR